MSRGSATLRSKLLRWLLIPLSLLFVVDAIGSYFLARHLSNRVYDGELMEIARELNLHVKVVGAVPAFDLEKDAERTLLLDQYDDVYYAVRTAGGVLIAGDAELPPGRPDAAPLAYDGQARGSPVRIAQIRGADHGRAPFTVQVAETLVKRHMLANEILIGVILPQLLVDCHRRRRAVGRCCTRTRATARAAGGRRRPLASRPQSRRRGPRAR